MGPRQLGSRSPAASPQPIPIARASHEELPSRTPSPLDDDPFLPLSHRKKRYYESEINDDDSFSSKRALRELQDGSKEIYSKSTTPDQSDRYADSIGRIAEVSSHPMTLVRNKQANPLFTIETRSHISCQISYRL
jgi:hypothetical protein